MQSTAVTLTRLTASKVASIRTYGAADSLRSNDVIGRVEPTA